MIKTILDQPITRRIKEKFQGRESVEQKLNLEAEYEVPLPVVDVGVSRVEELLNNTQVNEGKVLPICYRCTHVPKEGLYDGFRVQGMFFCSDCQREMFSAEQGSPEYQEFLFLIKGILCRGNS